MEEKLWMKTTGRELETQIKKKISNGKVKTIVVGLETMAMGFL